jgi:hypothetical protein
MAKLENQEIQLLDRIVSTYEDRHELVTSEALHGDLACWNWALSGLAKRMVWPEYIYGYVNGLYSEQDLQKVSASKGKDWFEQQTNIATLSTIKTEYKEALKEELPADVIPKFSGRIAALAADANQLQRTQEKTNYSLFMYSDRYSDYVTVPNFTHWWLDIKGICIELFPGMKHIQVYHGHQPLNKHPVWRTYLSGLRTEHITLIRKIISKYKKDIRRNSLPSGVAIVSSDPLSAPLDAALEAPLEWRRGSV